MAGPRACRAPTPLHQHPLGEAGRLGPEARRGVHPGHDLVDALDERVSRELGVGGATLSQWREQFVHGGQASLKARDAEELDANYGKVT